MLVLPAAHAQEQLAPPAQQARGVRTSASDGFDRQGRNHVISRLELKETQVNDVARMIAETAGMNIVATPEAGTKQVSLYLQNVTAIDAIETLSKLTGLWYREDVRTGTIRIMTAEQYQQDLIIHRDDVTRVFTLLHPNATSAAQSIQDLYGSRVILSLASASDDDFLGGGGGMGGSGAIGGGMGGGFGVGPSSGGAFGRPAGVAGGNQFARPPYGTAGGAGPVGSGIGGTPGDDLAPTTPLTPEQISQLERRAGTGLAADARITDDLLRQVTNREPNIYVTINRQHNLVIVRTSDEAAMQAIEKLILEIDRPTPEVLLEMKILELTLSDDFRRAFDIKFADGSANSNQPQASFLLGSLARNTIGVGAEPLASGTFVYQYLNDHIRAQIQWFDEHRCLHTVATPLLLASNNRPARIFVGEERVMTTGVNTNVVTPGAGAVTTAIEPVTEVRDIGVTLLIVPKINADRTVTLTITHESSTLKPGSASLPVAAQGGGVQTFSIDTVDTATLQGTVVAKDGLTIALGGMIRETTVHERRKVPVLGDLPGLRHLFTRKIETDERRELVLLITPHVITTPAEGELKTQWRMDELSRHPYHQAPRATLQAPAEQLVIPPLIERR